MKKQIGLSILSSIVIIVAIMVFTPRAVTGARDNAPEVPGSELPDSVLKFVQNACMDCHSDEGSSMARGKVNFSKWSTYDAEKQLKKAREICKEVTKNEMPPKKWRANNPDNVPTQAQIDMVCRWVKSLEK